ncbi:hypothetical protein PCANC_27587 [Puccinia coronata f. sp. avenae]|uniref:Uncharacterized protein n=1 Tax=Puccinia coronata f. sp. avenae TaxID=200324 RepID=A0A2N5S0H5_9BASI|nr:hypothetical protein PCANC_27587 [Puccinia coronata f. sp. avenae]PLW08506.1 hypothetical protein PCASD_25429 [Puccinia coronata f. sp. avenae]
MAIQLKGGYWAGRPTGGPNPHEFGPGSGQIFGENSYIGPARLAQDLGWFLSGDLSGAQRACSSPGARQSSSGLRSQESSMQTRSNQNHHSKSVASHTGADEDITSANEDIQEIGTDSHEQQASTLPSPCN